ncbi:lamin tail domain-containing protein [Patescibacteria group bacterium]|nr:lamin tail domain-containing protein [Patescibacteria group bacterium]MBU1673799.1 lamin tail domain-containing protein [Patescibacteria group bacterium]MBU1963826.1 lamin tail domain-containing protein [Patescibacteria group bacterium]
MKLLITITLLFLPVMPAMAAEMCECPCSDLYEFSDKIIINEIFPAPESGGVEFIELKNTGSKKVNLTGWKLSDASSKMYTIEGEIDEYFVVTGDVSKIFLNNGGDSVELYGPDEGLIQTVDYDSADTGTAYAFDGSDWAWTGAPTPGGANEFVGAGEDGEDGESGGDLMTIAEARKLEKGTDAKIQGIVSVEPGILGTQIFYIQDDEAGILVYCSKKEFPSGLKPGDMVEVRGEISESRNEKKINYSTIEDVEVIGSGSISPLGVESLGEEVEGRLVSVEGPILEKSSNKIYLDNDIVVYIKTETEIDKGDFDEGDVISVIGIVSQYDDDYRMMPRSKEDIEKQSSAAGLGGLIKAAHAAGSGDGSLMDKIPQPEKYFYYIGGAILALLIGLGIAAWKLKWLNKLKKGAKAFKGALQE